MLKIEDVKVGDELVCIDLDGYVNQDNGSARIRKQILKGPIVVFEITKNGVSLTRSGLQIPLDSLKHFKNKEQPQYTFDDLIDVARKAFDEGVLQGYAVENKLVKSLSIKFSDTKVLTWHLGDDDYSIPIGHIQSLYKEAFVIECEEDLKRVKSKPKITLNNSEVVPFTFKEAAKDHLIFYDQAFGHNLIHFVFLKGATVEQERGRDD